MLLRALVPGLLVVLMLTGGDAGGAPAGQPDTAKPAILIKAGRLVDVVAGRVLTDQVVVVQGGSIVAVGKSGSVEVPAQARTIDLSAYTLLPGLIDAHTHMTSPAEIGPYEGFGISTPRYALYGATHARKTLRAGFTAVRDVGATGFADVALRDAINDGGLAGPRMLVSGPALGITGGHCDENLLAPEFDYRSDGVADGPDGVRTGVRRNVKYGVDVIKYCGTGGVFSKGDSPGGQQYTVEEVAALIDEAHMHGRKVAVHAHGAEGIKVALRAGADSIEHASLIDDEGLALAVKLKTPLSMDIYNTDYTQAEGRKRGELEEFLRKDAEIGEVQRENFRKAVRAGARLTFATDSGVYPHGDNTKQFAVMVRYGMTPMQAIQAATVNGAELFGWKGRAGVIAPRAHADLIAVRNDPLADVRALESISFVMKGGEVYLGDAAACAAAASALGCEIRQ